MSHSLPSIDLNLAQKLQDEQYRRRFFLAEASADIARQLVRLRRRRKLSQKQLALKAGMAQPRISKVERADYENWSFNTLRRLAEAMDARLRVLIEPAEDILFEYGTSEEVEEGTYRASNQSSPPQTLSQNFLDQKSQSTLSGMGGTNGIEDYRQQPRHTAYPITSSGGAIVSADAPRWPPNPLSFSENASRLPR